MAVAAAVGGGVCHILSETAGEKASFGLAGVALLSIVAVSIHDFKAKKKRKASLPKASTPYDGRLHLNEKPEGGKVA